jgi:hypothetical protein
VGEEVRQKCIEENYFERIIVLKESAQYIIFIPGSAFINPCFGVFEWIEYVVKMNVDSTV